MQTIAENKTPEPNEAKRKAAEKPPEQSKVPEPPKVEEKEIDPEKMIEDISEKIANKLKPKEPEATTPPITPAEDYRQWVKQFTEDTGKQPTYAEALEFMEQRLEAKAQVKQEEEQKAIEAQKEVEKENKKRIKEYQEQVEKEVNARTDSDLQDLYDMGKLTPIKDKDNPSDQGVVERRALFQAMLTENQKRIAEGKYPINSIKEIYAFYYTKPSSQPPGENAPIAVGRSSAPTETQATEKEISYQEIHKPWSFFKRG